MTSKMRLREACKSLYKLSSLNGISVLWEGENYVIIRARGRRHPSRNEVLLIDKTGLLVDDNSAALTQIAAGYHPVQRQRALKATVLHRSGGGGALRGRWCKTLRNKCIDYGRIKEASYQEDLSVSIMEWERKQDEKKRRERRTRKLTANLYWWIRKRIHKGSSERRQIVKSVIAPHSIDVELPSLGTSLTIRARLDKLRGPEFSFSRDGSRPLGASSDWLKRYVDIMCDLDEEHEAQFKTS